MMKKPRWTTEELTFLRVQLGILTYKQIAQQLNRTVMAVKSKAIELQLNYVTQRQHYLSGQHVDSIHLQDCYTPLLVPSLPQPESTWSVWDELRAKVLYGAISHTALAKLLGRTPYAIHARLSRYHWSLHKAMQLRKLFVQQPDPVTWLKLYMLQQQVLHTPAALT